MMTPFTYVIRAGTTQETQASLQSVLAQKLPEEQVVVYGGENGVPLPGGSTGAWRNEGCRHAKTPVIVLIRGGVTLAPDWRQCMAQGHCYDLVGSCLTTPHGGKRGLDWYWLFPFHAKPLPVPLEYGEWTNRGCLGGGVLVANLSIWKRHPFPETDTDDALAAYCLRCGENGERIGLLPSAKAFCPEEVDPFAQGLAAFHQFQHHLGMGETAFRESNYPQAVSHLHNALRLCPTEYALGGKLGLIHLRFRRFRLAQEAFDRVLSVLPSAAYALAGKGWALLPDAPEEAEPLFERLRASIEAGASEYVPEFWRGRAWAAFFRKDYRRAVALAEEGLGRCALLPATVRFDLLRIAAWAASLIPQSETAATHFSTALENLAQHGVNANELSLTTDLLREHLKQNPTPFHLLMPVSAAQEITLAQVCLSIRHRLGKFGGKLVRWLVGSENRYLAIRDFVKRHQRAFFAQKK